MLLNICKSCQYCLETVYWKCCEEKFCFDKKIATFKLEENVQANGYANMGASLDSVITGQPVNNNHLPPTAIVGREINEIPLHADKLYEVFSKSLIFREEHELKSKDSTETLDDIETKSEPDYHSDKPNRTKVYFEDEINSPVTDFEIMFKDELTHDMFKIEEEEEVDKQSNKKEEGLMMNVVTIRKQDVVKPTTVTMKDESKITIQSPIYKYNPGAEVSFPSTLSLPRIENVKSILRQPGDISRSNSAKTLDLPKKPQLNRVESLKSIDTTKINRVLSRVPHRSASYLNLPEHLAPEKPPLVKSKSMVGVGVTSESEVKLSSLPDTPIIRSNNLPRFFDDSPSLPGYKNPVTLQMIRQKSSQELLANDFSMPRYYGKVETVPVHESKSMPDLRNPVSNGKVSKRLVKLRGKLKPLVIKKDSSERL